MHRDSPGRIAVLVRHNLLLHARDPGHLVSYLLMPMLLMLALRPLYDLLPDGRGQAVTGMLVMFSVLSLSIVGSATLTERGWHTWDRLRATDATATELVLAKAIPVYSILLVQQAVLLGYGALVLGMRVAAPLLLAMAVAAWGFALLAFGTLLAAVVRSHGELAAICDIGALAISSLGGALVPVSRMPAAIQPLAPLSPGYWASGMLRSAAAGEVAGTVVPAVVLVLAGVVLGAVACRRLTRGWGRVALR